MLHLKLDLSVNKVLKVQLLTLHIGPTGFSFVAKNLDAMLQSSAEVTLHACTPLSVYIAECHFSTRENKSYYFECFLKIFSFTPALPPFWFSLNQT